MGFEEGSNESRFVFQKHHPRSKWEGWLEGCMVPGREARCTVERRVGVGLSQGSSGRVGRSGGRGHVGNGTIWL